MRAELYPLGEIFQAPPHQVGETALMLHDLLQAGYSVPTSWVIPSDGFDQTLASLVSREPLFAEGARLLWQMPDTSGSYAKQRLAQRLRRPLLTVPLNLDLEGLLAFVDTPILRLLPSIWLTEPSLGAGMTALMGEQICWANENALESALKRLWAEAFSARSLTYWGYITAGHPPLTGRFGLAVLVQAIYPAQVSGTLTVVGETLTVQAVQGLPQALRESFPDRAQGSVVIPSPLRWQRGCQEQSYQPADPADPTGELEDCLTAATTPNPYTALDKLPSEATSQLLALARQLHRQYGYPVRVEWQWPMGAAALLSITQGNTYPFSPLPTSVPAPADRSHPFQGMGASPGRVIASALVIDLQQPLPTTAENQIVVALHIAPDWLPWLRAAAALVSEQGGLTCHAAVLARELGIPAVVGIPAVTHMLQTGDRLHVDGDRGWVEKLAPALKKEDLLPLGLPQPAPLRPASALQTELWLNLSQPDRAAAAAALPVAGVGLLRSEWLLLPCLDQRHPHHWLDAGQGERLRDRLVAQLRPILKAFAPRPVRYRSLDLRSHEVTNLVGSPPVETNPMLGLRGTFSYQQRPDLFYLELAALRQLQTEGHTNLQLLLPFVRTVEEFQYCKAEIATAGIDQGDSFQLWIMAEVPSVLFLLPAYVAAGVQGIAIGSNDLTQLLLGVDRDQAALSTQFDERHPAVQAAIAHLIQQARTLQIPCSICGLAPARYPELITALVQWGITSISVDAGSVVATAAAIAQAEASQ